MKFRNPSSGNKISKKNLYVTIFIVLLMVSSVIGFVAFSGQGENKIKADYEYNGFNFFKINNGWITKINSGDIYFDYLPSEVKDISYDNSKLSTQNKVYVAYGPSKDNIDFVLSKVDSNIRLLGYSTNLACIKEENCPDIPVVNCQEKDNIILLRINEKNNIYRDNGCIVIEGEDIIGLAKATDKFIYSISGMI